jgi:hypothetical protein
MCIISIIVLFYGMKRNIFFRGEVYWSNYVDGEICRGKRMKGASGESGSAGKISTAIKRCKTGRKIPAFCFSELF